MKQRDRNPEANARPAQPSGQSSGQSSVEQPSLLATTAISREALQQAAAEAAARADAQRQAVAAAQKRARTAQPKQTPAAKPRKLKTAARELFSQEEGTALERRLRRDRIFFNNPVIMQGLGLAPLIVAATTLKNAWMLTVAVLLLLMPTRLLAAFVSRITPFRFRGLAYALCAGTVYIGVYWVMGKLFPAAELALLGLYLPLLVVDPIILKRYERAQNEQPGTAVRKGLITALGYVTVLLVMGGARELLGAGTLYGAAVLPVAPLPLARLPVGGFAILAVLMVFWRSFADVIRAALDEEMEDAA